ncbi:MAG: ISNCY family transposase [Candidatus Pacebacteria bacterium]|jgi:hypothetical protein|nr:ISNCY family transposase [Candidatus Paceibacterota bacterium]
MEKELIAMTRKELARYEVIKNLIAKALTANGAAKQLALSIRQVKRLKARVRRKGIQGIVHGLRGRDGNRKIDPDVWRNAKEIILAKYPDFGPTLAHEKLVEVEELKIGKQTTRNLMIAEKIWIPKPRKQNKEYRHRRERKECFGEMEQFDGCYHHWFEGRGEEACLLASIDDATGKITKAEFTDSESVANVFKFWKGYIQDLGKPIAIYLDKFSTYKINHKNARDNSELITQFQRAARELDINLITANSPQAKGRIERLFPTLQDRLVKELRLRGISGTEIANKFLKEGFIPDFNKRFSVVARKKNDLHRRLAADGSANLEATFAVQSVRQIQNDFTIRFKNQWYQIAKKQSVTVRRKDEVLLEERLDSSLAIRLRGKYLVFKVLPEKPRKLREEMFAIPARKMIAPPPDHAWRKRIAAEIARINS